MMWWEAWGWMMFFWMLLFFGLVVAAIVLLVRGLPPHRWQRQGGSRAREILEERFARGEIDREEYEERRRALEESA